jgi:hypothetical protein
LVNQTVIKYAIRQKSTGWYLPRPYGRAGRGGSHMEPTPIGGRTMFGPAEPRLFDTERSARNALIQWLKGKWVAERYGDEYDFEETIDIIPQPHRDKDDMEIVPILIEFP